MSWLYHSQEPLMRQRRCSRQNQLDSMHVGVALQCEATGLSGKEARIGGIDPGGVARPEIRSRDQHARSATRSVFLACNLSTA